MNDFALVRGAKVPVTSKQEAEKTWEPLFIAEIVARKDPRKPPLPEIPEAGELTPAEFLNLYEKLHVEPEGLRSVATVKGRLKTLRQYLGHLPLKALERPDEILEFKADYRGKRSIATVNRVLSQLRSAVNWERFQQPPLLATSPFHKFGVSIRVREEPRRDRRVLPAEEQKLLEACRTMSAPEHKRVGAAMHDRIIAAIETCCRLGEMLHIRNRDVDWDNHQILIRGENAKDGENRRIPFDSRGRLAAILKRRGALGPNAYVFGSPAGTFQGSIRTAWESLLLVANGVGTRRQRKGARVSRENLDEIDLHWHDLRHEGSCRLLADGVDIRTVQLMLGHSTLQQTQRYLNITDEEPRRAMTGVWERRRKLKVVGQR